MAARDDLETLCLLAEAATADVTKIKRWERRLDALAAELDALRAVAEAAREVDAALPADHEFTAGKTARVGQLYLFRLRAALDRVREVGG